MNDASAQNQEHWLFISVLVPLPKARLPRCLGCGLGKPSLTRWEKISAAGNCSLVRLTPVTGRSHQLRVHLQAIGHPILGDPFYAHPQALAAAPRLLLHAAALALPHPETGEWMQFTSAPDVQLFR